MSRTGMWTRIPLVARAIIVGFFISALGASIWTALIAANLGTTPNFPWAVPVMAMFLWLLWQYLNGKGWPQSTSGRRRSYLRANPVSAAAWKWALPSGVSAVVALAGLWIVMGQLVKMPVSQLPDMSAYPTYVTIPMLIMASLVAPISEESGFRGYTQVPLEKVYGPVMAILISSIAFSLAHFTHGVFVPKLFLYFLGGMLFGVTAYLTNSILPGIVIHIVADLTFFLFVWPGDEGRVLVWESGADIWFWIHIVQVLGFGAMAVFGYRKLTYLEPRDALPDGN